MYAAIYVKELKTEIYKSICDLSFEKMQIFLL